LKDNKGKSGVYNPLPHPYPAFFLYLLHKIKIYRDGAKGKGPEKSQ